MDKLAFRVQVVQCLEDLQKTGFKQIFSESMSEWGCDKGSLGNFPTSASERDMDGHRLNVEL